VVPVKRFAETKRRLMPLLSPRERSALAGVMLHDVLAAIARARSVAGVVVVTDERRAAAAAQAVGAVVLGEAGSDGLNAALARAAGRLADDGANGMLVLPADVPLITAADIDAIVLAHRAAPSVTLVPAASDGGTNAFASSPPLAVACRFGEDSFRRHRDAAATAGIAATVLRLGRVGSDLDRPGDLARFLLRPSPTRSYAYLMASGIARRLGGIDRERCWEPAAARTPP
jgi:2-phospho-L-lactate guanylyltransferase